MQDLLDFAEQQFNFLTELEFERSVETDSLTAVVLYRQACLPFALETRFDWRDAMVSVMVVRLFEGQMPQGLYLHAGQPCRKYLAELVRQFGWDVPEEAWQRLTDHNSRRKSRRELPELKRRVEDLASVLRAVVGHVMADPESLFALGPQ